LHLILQYPSFVREQDLRPLRALAEDPADPEQTGRFYRISGKEESAEFVGMLLDLSGSSRFCSALEAAGIGDEGQVREALLLELTSVVLRLVRDDAFGLLPLKTEGDALVAVVALTGEHKEETAPIARLLERVAELVSKDWPDAMRTLAETKSWNQLDQALHPGLRITISRGDVEHRPQLNDILGKAVTGMFVHEAVLKEWPENTGVVVLGESGGIVPETILATRTLPATAKTLPVSVFAVGVGLPEREGLDSAEARRAQRRKG
jgi:hypothetical protein